jgi:hypothetical protein
MPSSPNYVRNYKEEYAQPKGGGSAKAKKKRALNNKARRQHPTARKGDGKDVAHKDNNTSNNSPSNLSLQSHKRNRSFPRTTTAGRKHGNSTRKS